MFKRRASRGTRARDGVMEAGGPAFPTALLATHGHPSLLRCEGRAADRAGVEADDDLTRISDDDLLALANRLAEDEQRLSRKRTSLHRRIDFLRAGAATTAAEQEQLKLLLGDEETVSKRRKALHGEIELVLTETHRRAADRRGA